MNHEEITKRFAARKKNRFGKIEWTGHNVFCKDRILYSYGYHFPLAISVLGGFLETILNWWTMKEISETVARRLILGGEAGYWSIHARSVPLQHDKQYVLRLRGKLWLVGQDKFRIEYVGYAGVLAGRHKGAFSVTCDDEEIIKMAKEEMAERGVMLTPDGAKEVRNG